MKKLLVFQHVPHEILGTLNPLLKRAGFRIRYVNFARHPDAEPSLNGYDGLVVLGGPMSVNDTGRLAHLTIEMKLIEEAMKKNLPVLGICLGAQLIAKTLGADVYANKEKEIGWYDVSPTDHAENDPLLMMFQTDRENLSVARRDLRHPQKHSPSRFLFPVRQSSLSLRRQCLWLSVSSGSRRADDPSLAPRRREQKEITALGGKIDPERHSRGNAGAHQRDLHQLSERVFGEFINLFGIEKKFRHHPSR